MACEACKSGKPCPSKALNGCSTRGAPIRYDWDPEETDSLEPWGAFGGNVVGGVRYRTFGPCDHVLSVSAALIDTDGNPITADSSIAMFFLPRKVDRLLWQNGTARNPITWRNIVNRGQREFIGGIEFTNPVDPRELTATNFGQGWGVGSDWTSEPGRDDPMSPVLYVLYSASETGAFDLFNANMRYLKGSH